MRAVALTVLLLFLAVWPVFAQAALMEAIFLPPRFFVGDRVELRLTYDLPGGVTVEPPAQLPDHDWIEFRSIEVQDRRASGGPGELRVRIFFIPFFPGETVLPSLR